MCWVYLFFSVAFSLSSSTSVLIFQLTYQRGLHMFRWMRRICFGSCAPALQRHTPLLLL